MNEEKQLAEQTRNEMEIMFDALSENEGFARVAVGSFLTCANPTLEEIADVKTAVSEAVTNSIIHGYRMNRKEHQKKQHPKICIHSVVEGKMLTVEISDAGCGIEDVEKAMQPLFTTRPELERSGMGFAFMEAFMDNVDVKSELGKGTKVIMTKTLGKEME